MGRCKLTDSFTVGPFVAQPCQFCDALYVFLRDGRLKASFDRDGVEVLATPHVCAGGSRGNSFSQKGQEVDVARDGKRIYHLIAPGGSLDILRCR
jgi:hypothetical protein